VTDTKAKPAEPEKIRLNLFLARAGLGSRRSVESLINAGKVRINGAVVTDFSARVDPAGDSVTVDRKKLEQPQEKIYLLFHKPAGCDVTRSDRFAIKTVFDCLPKDLPRSVQAAGRLDRDTTGLLLLTNDGELAYRLTHPRHGIEKEYLAFGKGSPTREQIRKLLAGVELEDGNARAVRAEQVRSPRPGIRIVMHEGRKRIVRRMCDAIGYPLAALHRERMGPVTLASLREGKYRRLTAEEVERLKAATNPEGPRDRAGKNH
jgi:pseudouridine synthase